MKLPLATLFLFSGLSLAEPITLFVGTNKDIHTVSFSTGTGAFSNQKIAHPAPSSSFLAFSGDKKFLYSTYSVALPDSKQRVGGVASYSLSAASELKEISVQPSGGRGTCHVSIDLTGKCLFSADYGSGHLASYSISPTGALSEAVSTIPLEGSSVHPRQKAPHAHSIYPSPDNKHVYAADLGTDQILCYTLDSASAKLTHLTTAKVPPGSGPRHIAIHPDGKRLFVLNELSCTVSTFQREPDTGKLTLLSTVSVLKEKADKISCSEIRLSPDSKHLYTGNRDIAYQKRDSISHFTISENPSEAPQLQQVLTLPISIPRHFTITPSGKWLIAGGQKSDELISIKRDQKSGQLSLTEHKITVPSPTCILVKTK